MTLLKKPKRVDYRASPNAGELFPVHEHDYAFLLDERDYYKAVAEFAFEALLVIRMECPTIEDADIKAMVTIEAIRQTEQ